LRDAGCKSDDNTKSHGESSKRMDDQAVLAKVEAVGDEVMGG
jgi:hypothetical protein